MSSYSDSYLKMVGTGDFTKSGALSGLSRNTWNGNGANYIGFGAPDIPIQPLSDTNWEIVGTGYFDGITDKAPDILWRNKVTGDNAIWFMDGTRFLSAALLQEVPDVNWKIGGTGDFNGDKYTDIVWHHATTGLNYVWFMQGINLIATAQIQSASDTNWEIVGADFFNSDANCDLLWRNKSTGDNALWFMNGTTLQSTATLPYASSYWKVGGTGKTEIDIDGDWLRDLWERRYFGNLDQTGTGDYDSDGYTNQQEFNSGTDPTDFYSHQYASNSTLANGVDNMNLAWSYSGGYGWVYLSAPDYPGGYRNNHVQSVQMYDNQSTSIQTTVSGAGTVVFRWKVSSESNADPLIFYIDGVEQTRISGEVSWHHRKFSVAGAGNHVLKWTYSKDYCCASGSDAGSLDYVEFYPAGGGGGTLGEALESPELTWSTSGSPVWVPQTGVYSPSGKGDAAEASPGSGQQSFLTVVAQGTGWFFFDWKLRGNAASSLYLYVDGALNRTLSSYPDNISDWKSESVALSGNHTIEFRLSGPSGAAAGENFAWIDNFQIHYDLDNDGLEDAWENYYFGNLNQSATGDPDGDGFDNLQEYLNITNPTQPDIKVKILTPLKNSLLP